MSKHFLTHVTNNPKDNTVTTRFYIQHEGRNPEIVESAGASLEAAIKKTCPDLVFTDRTIGKLAAHLVRSAPAQPQPQPQRAAAPIKPEIKPARRWPPDEAYHS